MKGFLRLALLAGLPVLALAAVWNGGGVGVVIGWALTGYLAWRAWPAVRLDLRRLGGLRFSRARGRYL